MSNTKRKALSGYKPYTLEEVDDGEIRSFKAHRKMAPYAKTKGVPKFKAHKTDHVGGYSKGVSKADKLNTKNANRSFKKGARQQGKKLVSLREPEFFFEDYGNNNTY